MGRILYPRENPEGSGAGGDDGCCRRAYVNAAGSAQVFHGGDPGTRYLALAAELDNGGGQMGVGVFRQEDPLGAALPGAFFSCLTPTTFCSVLSSQSEGGTSGAVSFRMSIRESIILNYPEKSTNFTGNFLGFARLVFPSAGNSYQYRQKFLQHEQATASRRRKLHLEAAHITDPTAGRLLRQLAVQITL